MGGENPGVGLEKIYTRLGFGKKGGFFVFNSVLKWFLK